MISIRFAQCLCPARHTILAAAATDERASDADLEAILRRAVQAALDGQGATFGLPASVKPWCSLCGAPAGSWRYEVRTATFEDWAEAMDVMNEAAAANQRTHALAEFFGRLFVGSRKGSMN